MATYRIISLDGGGIRGLVTTILIQRLGAELEDPTWYRKADLIAGTSTGGLIALGLGAGLSVGKLRALYETKGEKIFADTLWDDIRDVGRVMGAEYSTTNIERELKAMFGRKRLSSLNPNVLVTAFDLDNESPTPQKRMWKPKVFHNFRGPGSDGAKMAYKVGLYTSAAPTYFPSYDGYVDGGVFANNPAMCALTQTQDERYLDPPPALDEIHLISLGTGIKPTYVKGDRLDWGILKWGTRISDVMIDGVSGIADYQCRQLLDSRYHRLAPLFPAGKDFPLDGVKQIPDLAAFADRVRLGPTINWLRGNWY